MLIEMKVEDEGPDRGFTFSNFGIDYICQVIPLGIVIMPKSGIGEAYVNTYQEREGKLRQRKIKASMVLGVHGPGPAPSSTPFSAQASTPLPSDWIPLPQALER